VADKAIGICFEQELAKRMTLVCRIRLRVMQCLPRESFPRHPALDLRLREPLRLDLPFSRYGATSALVSAILCVKMRRRLRFRFGLYLGGNDASVSSGISTPIPPAGRLAGAC
jgi:hypothetical protein